MWHLSLMTVKVFWKEYRSIYFLIWTSICFRVFCSRMWTPRRKTFDKIHVTLPRERSGGLFNSMIVSGPSFKHRLSRPALTSLHISLYTPTMPICIVQQNNTIQHRTLSSCTGSHHNRTAFIDTEIYFSAAQSSSILKPISVSTCDAQDTYKEVIQNRTEPLQMQFP